MKTDLREFIDIEVILVYVKYTVILMVKMMLMSALTGFYRMKNKVECGGFFLLKLFFSELVLNVSSLRVGLFNAVWGAFVNPEDAASHGKGDQAKKYLRTDPVVERVRRIHLNDLENLVPFVIIGFVYSLSGVSYATALMHYRIFAASRIFHTIAYLVPLPQPCRGLAWLVGYIVTFSMVYKLIVVAMSM